MKTTTPVQAHRASGRLRVVAWLACAWMVLFACIHAYWGVGGTFALPNGVSVQDKPVLFAINIIAIPLCLVGAALALALLHPIGRRYQRMTLLLTVGAGLLGVVHSADTIVRDIGMVFGLVDVPESPLVRVTAFVFEPWWLLGGILFLVAAALFRAETAEPSERS